MATSAFQANAFQTNQLAFQIAVSVSGSHSSGLGSGGGGPFGGSRRRRSINFEKMYDVIDKSNQKNEKDRRSAFERIDKTIERLVKGLEEEAEEAKEANRPPPKVDEAVKVAGVISKQIAGILVGPGKAKPPVISAQSQAIRQQVQRFEQHIRVIEAQRLREQQQAQEIDQLKGELNRLQMQMQATRDHHEAKQRELEDEMEDLMLLLL